MPMKLTSMWSSPERLAKLYTYLVKSLHATCRSARHTRSTEAFNSNVQQRLHSLHYIASASTFHWFSSFFPGAVLFIESHRRIGIVILAAFNHIWWHGMHFYRASQHSRAERLAVLAIVNPSVRQSSVGPSVRHTLALCQYDSCYDYGVFTLHWRIAPMTL